MARRRYETDGATLERDQRGLVTLTFDNYRPVYPTPPSAYPELYSPYFYLSDIMGNVSDDDIALFSPQSVIEFWCGTYPEFNPGSAMIRSGMFCSVKLLISPYTVRQAEPACLIYLAYQPIICTSNTSSTYGSNSGLNLVGTVQWQNKYPLCEDRIGY